MPAQYILYPIFEECGKFTLDPYWQDIFSECAGGKFPKGMKYDPTSQTAYIKSEGKLRSVAYCLTNEPTSDFTTLMTIFRTQLNLHSTRDIKTNLETIESAERTSEDCPTEWKKIKPKSRKDDMILNFVLEKQRKRKLTTTQTKHLLAVIQTGIQFKSLIPEDINIEDGRIKSISGLRYNKNKKEFYLKRGIANVSSRSEKTTTPDRFQQALDKYVKEMR